MTTTTTAPRAGFVLHTNETVSDAGRAPMDAAKAKYGFVPNLMAAMVEAPALGEAYLAIGDLFTQSSFTAGEQQVVLQAANHVNACHYCVPAHATIIKLTGALPQDESDRLTRGESLADAKLEALRTFATAVTEQRGHVSDDELQAFFDAGYTRRQALEVVLGNAYKTMSNYANAILHTPLDDAFKGEADKSPIAQP